MIGRRSILTAFLGAMGAAGSGIKPGAAARAAGLLSGVSAGAEPEYPTTHGVPCDPLDNREFIEARGILRALWAKRERHESRTRLPAHIATKRSWSPAFKEHVAEQELREIEHARYLLDDCGPVVRAAALAKIKGLL
jgi:hypothetical protein